MALKLWAGKGIWEGWQMLKHYESCKFGDSVLVAPDGSTFYPEDLAKLKEKSVDEKSKNWIEE